MDGGMEAVEAGWRRARSETIGRAAKPSPVGRRNEGLERDETVPGRPRSLAHLQADKVEMSGGGVYLACVVVW